jgi:glycosyltransferase involved in cell wall biosynthesis
LNLLLISQYFPPDLGGVASRASNLTKGLVINGCNVTVITAFPHYPNGDVPKQYRWVPVKVEWIEKTRVIRTFMPPIKSEGFLKRLFLMGSFAISSLFALPFIGNVDAIWGGSWISGIVYSKLKRAPVVLDVCDLTLEDLPMLKLANENSVLLKIATPIYRIFYVQGDAVAPISPGYVRTINRKYGVEENRIDVIQVGVDEKEFKGGSDDRLEGEPFKVIYAGVLGVGYDFEQVFGAAKILEDKKVNVAFILHGSGECLESIKTRLKQLNLVNVLLSDKLLGSRKEVANFLNSADALILPLKDYGGPYPGIPSKLYEYQALGKPIICCAQGEPAKYISQSNSGIVVEPENSEKLAEAVSYLIDNIGRGREMGINGRKYIEREVTIMAIGQKAKALFERLIEEKYPLN